MTRRLATKAQRTHLLIEQAGRCAICGGDLSSDFIVDHVVPWVEHQETDLWTLQALCATCNRQKTSADLSRLLKIRRKAGSRKPDSS